MDDQYPTREQLLEVIKYAASVFPPHFDLHIHSLGCDIALAQLKNAAGHHLSDFEKELIEAHGEW